MTLGPLHESIEDTLRNLQPDGVEKYTIAYGNAFSGLTCRGLYDSWEEAISIAEREKSEDWQVVAIWKHDG